MNESIVIRPIAHIETDFKDKFGLPRQSGRVKELTGVIHFEKEGFHPEALRGIEDFSHLWLIWGFSKSAPLKGATVRPPRLGGNKRMGVFATRSPFRPNPLGLSCVKLEGVSYGEKGPVLLVSGVDLLDGTPIYDIKPYLPFADCVLGARGGFAAEFEDYALDVNFPKELLERIPDTKKEALLGVLREDPRPSYQDDERPYGMSFAGFEISFFVKERLLTVTNVTPQKNQTASKSEPKGTN